MQQVVIARDSGLDGREDLIYRQIEVALGVGNAVVARDVASLVEEQSPIGLERICPLERLVALGRAAHIRLADFEKRTLLAADLGLDADRVDIERLMWSSLNTTQAIALGQTTWRSMQLLPIDPIHHHPTPPLRMRTTKAPSKSSVRIVSHGHRPQAEAAAALLKRAGFIVVTPDVGWSDDAAVHLHLGAHDLDAVEPRLVDSWASGRLVIEVDGGGDAASPQQELRVDHERNGLVCRTIGDVATMCEDVRADEIFWGKLVKAGHKTIAPQLKGWAEIADRLVA